MTDERISLGSMTKILSDYAMNAERPGASSKVKRFTKANSMSEALDKLSAKVDGAGKSEQLSTLENLKKSVALLELREDVKTADKSILHKTSKIADFFRSLLNPSYSRQDSIAYARCALDDLSKKLDKEIEIAQTREKNNAYLAAKDLNETNLNKGKKISLKIFGSLQALVNAKGETEESGKIHLRMNRQFYSKLRSAGQEIKKEPDSLKKVMLVNSLWREGCAILELETAHEKQKVMELLVVELDLPLSFLDDVLSSDQDHLKAMLKVVTEAMIKVAHEESGRPHEIELQVTEALNQASNFNEENLNLARQKLKSQLQGGITDTVDSAPSKWGPSPFEIRVYRSKEFRNALAGKEDAYRNLRTDQERFAFIQECYRAVGEVYAEQKKWKIIGGDEAVEVRELVLAELPISAGIIAYECELSPQTEDEFFFTSLIEQMRDLTSKLKLDGEGSG